MTIDTIRDQLVHLDKLVNLVHPVKLVLQVKLEHQDKLGQQDKLENLRLHQIDIKFDAMANSGYPI